MQSEAMGELLKKTQYLGNIASIELFPYLNLILSNKLNFTNQSCIAISGGSKGCTPGVPPYGPKFSQFHAVFWKKCQSHMLAPPGGLVPPPVGNSGSAPGHVYLRHWCHINTRGHSGRASNL